MQNKSWIAICCALVTCLIWSGNFIIARGVHEWIPPISLAFWRWLIALLILTPITFRKVHEEWIHIKANLVYLFFMGLTGISMFNTIIYFAGHHTSASNLAIIMATAPILTIFFACLFRIESFSKAKSSGAVLALLGALLVISKGDLSSLLTMNFNHGDLLVSLSALIWAGWNLALVKKPKSISTLSFLAMTIFFGLLCISPFYAYEAIFIKATSFDLNVLLVFLYIGALASVLAWFLWQKAIEILGPVKTNLIYYSIPVFAAFAAFIILGESLGHYHYLAFTLVLCGVLISNLHKYRKKSAKAV